MNDYKSQLICLIVVLLLGEYYVRKKQLRTVTTVIYICMLCNLVINLVFDVITKYTVNHLDTIPFWLEDISHRVSLYTYNLFVFLLFYYLISYIRVLIKPIQIKIFLLLPIVISLITSVFGGIYYVVVSDAKYSLGPVININYVSCIFYIVCMIVLCIKHWRVINKNRRNGIIRSMVLVTMRCILQFVFPTVLISGFFDTLVIFNIFLSLEDPGEYVDMQTKLVNQYGFYKVLEDKMLDHKENVILTAFVIEVDQGKKDHFMMIVDKAFRDEFNKGIYRSSESSVSLIISGKSKHLDKLTTRYHDCMFRLAFENNIQLEWKNRECNSDQVNAKTIIDEIIEIHNNIVEQQFYIDQSTGVKNRNAYNKKIQLFNQKQQEIEKLWCLLIDVNHLKNVNDTLGHEKGDELIRLTAMILARTLKGFGEIYRYGGDEFVVFLEDINTMQLINVLETIENDRLLNSTDEIKVDFAIGYAKWNNNEDRYIEDLVRRADRNMYAIKKNMKNIEQM